MIRKGYAATAASECADAVASDINGDFMTTAATTTSTATKANLGRRRLKKEGRKKRALKLKTNKEFAKAYFDARSKRSTEKKSAFRKKKSKKK